MIIYKQKDFLTYMPDVQECNKSISDLNDQWDNIKLLSEINCPIQSKSVLPNMTKIQNGFIDLQEELIDTLVSEKLKKMGIVEYVVDEGEGAHLHPEKVMHQLKAVLKQVLDELQPMDAQSRCEARYQRLMKFGSSNLGIVS